MKDAPSCEKCTKIFPWNQRRLLWKHIQECTGPAESIVKVFLSPHLWLLGSKHVNDLHCQGILDHLLPRGEVVSQTHRRLQHMKMHTNMKCGLTFPWNQLQLRWKHKREPTEVAHALEHGVRTEINDATLTCKCGKSFPENQRRKFVRHKMQCSPRATLRAKRHRATLPQMLSTTKTPGKHH